MTLLPTPQRSNADMVLSCLQHRFPKRKKQTQLLIKVCEGAQFSLSQLGCIRENLVAVEQLDEFCQQMEDCRESGIDYLRTFIPKNQLNDDGASSPFWVAFSGLLSKLGF